jgi:peptidoglycan/xylan/chitin deacetylase (PgdA/CDA1 family)
MEDPLVTRACQEFVATLGGADFFRRPGWRDQLQAVHRAARANSSQAVLLDQDSFRSLVESDFLLSKRLFQKELGVDPRYMAFPWWLGSEPSIEAAARCGIKAVFGVDMDFSRAQMPGHPILVFGRLTEKWLRFLPGKGRRQLCRPQVMSKYFRHFFQRAFLAH